MMRKTFQLSALLVALAFFGFAQNDLDVIRYASGGVGGSARFMSMGGAFGALGADLSVANYNPAGLAVFRKGDLNFGGSLRISTNQGNIYNQPTLQSAAKFQFNNFGIAAAWKSASDAESRHVLAFNNSQTQNFSSKITMEGYTKNSSIAKDMLNFAEGQSLQNLNSSYEGLGFDTYLIDYDSVGGKYFSFLDVNRTVKQSRQISTSGRMNDLNFSYAYTHKDQFYFGLSVGVPQVDFSSTTTHIEADDLDSMSVTLAADQTYTSTYSQDLPFVYASKLGFNSLTYEEYFKTSGSGFNLKLGGIYRVNDIIRIGAYYHTPTFYRLNDQYQNTMSVSFDRNKNEPETLSYPDEGGTFSYRLVTPARISANLGIVIQKIAAIAIDYEAVNYKSGSLSSNNASDFSATNNLIQRKYTTGHNLRMGAELNLDPMKIRLGYAMTGSPFGKVFVDDFTRNTFSIGAGFRSKGSFYIDFVYLLSFYSSNYFLFNSIDTMAELNYRSGTLGFTAGFKF